MATNHHNERVGLLKNKLAKAGKDLSTCATAADLNPLKSVFK